jgi:hypothetical protein
MMPVKAMREALDANRDELPAGAFAAAARARLPRAVARDVMAHA